MRRPWRGRPRCVDAPAATAPESPRAPAECVDFVVLARRMSIPDDHAIRQFVDVSMGLGAAEELSQRD
jgi:hypothetical protein